MTEKRKFHLDINPLNLTDLDMYQCGTEKCEPGHDYGPAVRDHFLVHFVTTGKGTFYLADKEYQLEAGQGFLIFPEVVSYYRADEKDPWVYYWIGFHGLQAERYIKQANLFLEKPIFTLEGEERKEITRLFDEMIKTNQLKTQGIRLVGYLYIFLSHLIELASTENQNLENQSERYLQLAVEYIMKNYSREIRVAEISNYVGLDRSYLWSIFKKYLNISPQQFVIKYRLERACELLVNKDLTIGDIARSVGYQDQLLFSKTFKKTYQQSPSEYRNKF